MRVLEGLIEDMILEFNDLTYSLEEFTKNPTGGNRKIVLNDMAKFNSTKNKLSTRLRNMLVKWGK